MMGCEYGGFFSVVGGPQLLSGLVDVFVDVRCGLRTVVPDGGKFIRKKASGLVDGEALAL
jgi:hypothetical protein